VRMFGGEIPRVPSAAIKNTCLTVYIVLLGFSYRTFESTSFTGYLFFFYLVLQQSGVILVS